MSGWVTVTGPPLRICSRKSGITDPADASTLPKRTDTPPPVDSLARHVSIRFTGRPLFQYAETMLVLDVRQPAQAFQRIADPGTPGRARVGVRGLTIAF